MKYYVVADVHGFYTPLHHALERAGFFEESEPHKLIICGDMFDRGHEARRLQDFAVSLFQEDRLIFIKGNHEDMLEQLIRQVEAGDLWRLMDGSSHHVRNSTWDTALQLSGMVEPHAFKRPLELVSRVKKSTFYRTLLPNAIPYYETDHYIFTHGWIPCGSDDDARYYYTNRKYFFDPNWREASSEAWFRARWCNGIDLACRQHLTVRNKTVVCGHWNASYGHSKIDGNGTEMGEKADHSPFYADGIIAIDAGTVHSGTVNCLVLEDTSDNVEGERK